MARFNLYKDGEFVNSIEADPLFAMAYCQSNGYTMEELPDPKEAAPELTPEERLVAMEAALAAQDEALIELYEMMGG